MSHTFDSWTPGVSLIAQRPSEVEQWTSLAWATHVRQAANTDNWFHVPLTSASTLDNDPSYIEHAWLLVQPQDSVWIEYVRIHQTSNRFSTHKGQIFEESWTVGRSPRGQSELVFDVPKTRCIGPIVLSFFAHFEEGADRDLHVFGAAIRLEEE